MFALIRSRCRRSDAAFSIQTQYILTMSTKASKPSGGRGKNWADDECTTLAQNSICVSEDPQRGKDQPREEFWCRVAAKNEGRSADSCMKQFGRMAQAVQTFDAFVYQIGEKNVSGTTCEDTLAAAKQIYREDCSGAFKYFDAWKLLKECP